MSNYFALFDLDETIVRCKSLIETYRAYCLTESGEEQFDLSMQKFKKIWGEGKSREELNRLFYANFSGFSRLKMTSVINKWFSENLKNPDFFNQAVLKELRQHQKNGATIIIISGSFYDCVMPIAAYLNAPDFLSIELESVNDFYTGKITGIQTIGEGKLAAVHAYAKNLNINPAIIAKGGYAYGDHISDLSFLNFVEHPVVVGNNQELIAIAQTNHWQVLESEI